VDWRDYSDPSWRHPEHSLRYRGDLTNPLNKDFKARLNPVLCSSEWPPLRPENGPASKSDSDDESVLPELEVDSDEYGYYGHDGYYNEWVDASHLLHDTDGGPSGHPPSCCASGAGASADYSDPESIEWSDSEDDGDQPWSDQGEWIATRLIGASR
jgi:hypothetical protein